VVLAWFFYLKRPDIAATIRDRLRPLHTLLEQKYFMDRFNDWFFAGGARFLGRGLWRFGDTIVIDGVIVNGSAKLVGRLSGVVRKFQSGMIYHYAFTMIIGLFVLMSWWFLRI
jgi:NADH-quinone oxidoreductase subunit L